MDTLYGKSPVEKIHLERVCYYCMRIAKEMNMKEIELEQLRWTGLFHDIGKVTIDKEILEKREN